MSLKIEDPVLRWLVAAALAAGLTALLFAVPDRKLSPEQVFAEVARSVVVVYALDARGELGTQGSGVAVGKSEVATNCHVVEHAHSIAVSQAADAEGGETYRMSAQVIVSDAERDLCLLWVDGLSEPPAALVAEIGATRQLSVGESVFAVGAPQGLELSLSQGVVSQLRGIRGKRAAPLVQTDAAISPGSSGGGLFNDRAELVGITTFKEEGENLNFAIPVEWLEDLREKGWAELNAAERRQQCVVEPNYDCAMSFALFVAQGAEYPDDRGKALRGIAEAQAKTGDIEGALATARNIENADDRAWALQDIAEAQAKAGDIDGAFTTARGIEDTDRRALTLVGIARLQAETGDVEDALVTAKGIDEAIYRARALSGIAREQAMAGDIKEAFATARSIDDAGYRAMAMSGVAKVQGNIEGAFAMARGIDDADYRGTALAVLAVAQAKTGDINGALAMARSIDDADYRGTALALAGIAVAQAKTGDINGALAMARSIDNATIRAWALGGIAKTQAKEGNIKGALAMARSIDNADYRGTALVDIAKAQAESGKFHAAMKFAVDIEESDIRAKALAAIATHLAASNLD